MGCQELKKQETAEWDRNLRMGVKRLETGDGVGKDKERTAVQPGRRLEPKL